MEQSNEIYIEKKQFYLVMFISVLVLSAISIISIFVINDKIEKIDNEKIVDVVKPNENNEASVQVDDDIYLVKDYNGKIGIYKNDSLVYTLDVYVFTLPENDKKLLSEGIIITSQKELYDLIESYY